LRGFPLGFFHCDGMALVHSLFKVAASHPIPCPAIQSAFRAHPGCDLSDLSREFRPDAVIHATDLYRLVQWQPGSAGGGGWGEWSRAGGAAVPNHSSPNTAAPAGKGANRASRRQDYSLWVALHPRKFLVWSSRAWVKLLWTRCPS